MQEPCYNCPFRRERRFFGLESDRVLAIGESLRHDGFFPCHKTMGMKRRTHCIGAITVLENEAEGAMANACVRLAARSKSLQWPIAHNIPVYESFEEAARIIGDGF